jgi:UDP-N-acetylglucosamine--N-acetylmuramyl-(pentapeptide) pyrophosphoryl-undecaprenol N-acetylglucosamine transferase
MGPVVMAAIALNKYCVLQEQNSYPGLTTRQLAHKVDKVFLGFGVAAEHLHKNCTIVETGNPIKDVIGKISKNEGREYFGLNETDRVILILGGSQGALSINENILRNINTLPAGYQLIWQTGERDYKEVAAKAGGKVTGRALFTFTDKIELAYAAADIAIARAGALTLAELEAAGLPAILVPYPYATADHQRKNAEYFVESGAAVLFDDSQLDKVDLLNESIKLFEGGHFAIMAKAVDSMRRKRKKPAADMIVDEILSLIGYEGNPN